MRWEQVKRYQSSVLDGLPDADKGHASVQQMGTAGSQSCLPDLLLLGREISPIKLVREGEPGEGTAARLDQPVRRFGRSQHLPRSKLIAAAAEASGPRYGRSRQTCGLGLLDNSYADFSRPSPCMPL
jgi:hypothetical protein